MFYKTGQKLSFNPFQTLIFPNMGINIADSITLDNIVLL
jgi:hypothetical protein